MTTPQQVQSQVLGYVRQSQEVVDQFATIVTESWGGHRDDVLPRPAEFVDQWFDFWVQLLEAQRDFVLSGINTLVPKAPAPAGSVVSPATSARTADSTADEHIGGAAADAITTAAAITAGKTATVEKTPVDRTSKAEAPKKRATAEKTSGPKTSAPKKTAAPKKTVTSEKASATTTTPASKKTSAATKGSAAKKTSTAKKRS